MLLFGEGVGSNGLKWSEIPAEDLASPAPLCACNLTATQRDHVRKQGDPPARKEHQVEVK